MRNLIPCPSPRGTNVERLFLMRAPGGPTMALDAAISDPDDNGDGGEDLADKIHQLLDGKLDDADIEALIRLIQPEESDNEPMPAQDRRRQARDQPPPFRGRPVLAGDALRRHVAAG